MFAFRTSSRMAQSASQWVLDSATLSYHVPHPLHEVDRVSHVALAKGRAIPDSAIS